MKKIRKSVRFWQNYHHQLGGPPCRYFVKSRHAAAMQLTIPVSAVLCRLAACFHARQNEWNVHVFSHVLGVATAPPAVHISTDYTNDHSRRFCQRRRVRELAQIQTRGRRFDSQLSITLMLAVLACGCTVILISPSVTTLTVLNGPLGSLVVWCMWLFGLWHGDHTSVTGESATSHPFTAPQ